MSVIPALDVAAGDARRILGTWKAAAAERGGEPFEQPIGDLLTFRDDGTVIYTRDQADETQRGTYTIDTTASPRTITIGRPGPDEELVSIVGIYRHDEDGLTILLPGRNEAAPVDFKTEEGSRSVMVTLKRQPPDSDPA